ncbi:MAG: 50S ribosomal protein L15 [Candidatus Bathyarchaeota archaeon]|nr:50S ribosomal protein L15 [Candidatus Bathyarchaeota archaeon]MDH5494696.1 50S ribosomal protein L15 [Candidatus Bathyarchaeota archaeon]
MPHKLRKTRKKRGTRTVGWGTVGQHRGVGQRGGHGKAGRHKHLWSYVLRYEPDYFSKKGFYSSRRKKVNAVNIGKLEELAMNLSAEKGLEERDGMSLLDLDKLGYDKLLGMGIITKPFSIKVASYSESAAKKVEEAGGKIITET